MENHVRAALVRLNPEVAARPERADRSNVVVLVDEAHRTQEGDLGAGCAGRCPTRSCSA